MTRVACGIVALLFVASPVYAQSLQLKELTEVVGRLGEVTELVVAKIGSMRETIASLEASRVSPLAFGAKCDGVTDDTVALKATIAAADTAPYRTIVLPPSTCLFSDTLVFGNRTDRYSEISMEGHSEYTSTLAYVGPNTSIAIRLSHMSAFRWRSLMVSSGLSDMGSSIGIQIDGPFPDGGTQSVNMTFDHIAVQRFHIGMLAGSPGAAASEIECRSCLFTRNDIGWTASGYNSLNFWFYNVGLTANIVGLQVGGPWVTDAPHIVGGHSAGNTEADIKCGNGFGVLSVENFRAEISATSKFIKGIMCGHTVALRHVVVMGPGAVPVVDLAAGEHIRVEDSLIHGQMTVPSDPVTVVVQNTRVFPGTNGWPVLLPAPGHWGQRLRLIDNGIEDTWVTWFPNIVGEWRDGAFTAGQ